MATPFFGQCGRDLRLGRNVTFYNPSQIMLGDNVYIAYGCWFMAGDSKITIKDAVLFAPYVVISAGNHTLQDGSFRYSTPIYEKITIGLGCWIGSHVTINAGAEIGAGCLIASNASVTKGSIPSDSLLAGVPAEIKKSLKVELHEQ
jgi:acetyltransferase-like isoleucine patch superfamily enzyme